MFKAAIVEDEKILLDDLEEIIDWEAMGVEIAYTERNGLNAFRHFVKDPVDIVITDIRMPVMSGIEMAQKIREQDKNVQIIFLTGYEEIGYMKSAIGVDAVSYLLKPLQEEELKTAVKNAVEKIELINNAKIGKTKRLEEELMNAALNKVDSFPLLGNASYTLAIAKISRFQALSNTRSAAEMNWILERVRQNIVRFYQCRSEKVIISYISKGQFFVAAEDKEGYIHYDEAEVSELNEDLENLCRITLITTGEKMVYKPDEIRNAYKQILVQEKNMFYKGVHPQRSLKELLSVKKEKLISEIHKMSENQVFLSFQEYFGQIAYEKIERKQVIRDCFDICCSMYDSLQADHIVKGALDSEKRDWSVSLEEFESLSQIEKYMKQMYQSFLQNSNEDDYLLDEEKTVQKIIHYIDKHYAEPISAESLVEEVYFASNTIRMMIKKQTGRTVHEYLTKVRMDKATELLKCRDKKIKQIAREVGYDNVSYFCMRFSRDYGMSPLAYRKKYFMKLGSKEKLDEEVFL